MSDKTAIVIACIASLPPTVAAVLAWLQSRKNAGATQAVHVAINSRMDDLLTAAKGEAKAAGVEQERTRTENRS